MNVFIFIILMTVLISCSNDAIIVEGNPLYEKLYEVYELYPNDCNGHNTSTEPWIIYVDQDTPDSVINEISEDYQVVKRDHQDLSLDNLEDIAFGYFPKISSWMTLENRESYIKVQIEDTAIVNSDFIEYYINNGLIVVEYSEGDLVFT